MISSNILSSPILIFILGAAGYTFITRLYCIKYKVSRLAGYHLFFHSIVSGFPLFLSSYVIVYILQIYIFKEVITEFLILVLTLVFSYILPKLLNYFFYDNALEAKKAAKSSGDLIESIMEECFEKKKLIEISLKNGKSYIGFATYSGIMEPHETDVSLLPVASGYRTVDTKELKITTQYSRNLIKFSNENFLGKSRIENINDFRVIIPISEVISARIFLPAFYNLFRSKTDSSEEKPSGDIKQKGLG